MINYNDEYERWLRSDSLTEEEKKELFETMCRGTEKYLGGYKK